MSLRIYGNRLLKTLPGQDTRPTASMVRQALFNIWQGQIHGCRWLDLCAGTGAMGAEALGRSAAHVVGIEQAGRACSIIQENWAAVARPEQTFKVIRGDITQRLPALAGQTFDRIYFDPPYASDLYEPVLEAIAHFHLLAVGGEIAVEHHPRRWRADALTDLAARVSPLVIGRQKVYGNTALTFFAWQ